MLLTFTIEILFTKELFNKMFKVKKIFNYIKIKL